ncbi:MAG: SLC13 family permease [Caldilineaceae bacterium]|nr:SLC13 family permease [Caldilineaceae bacterium]
MPIDQLILLVILVAASTLYASRRLPFEVTAILIITSLSLTGILPPEKALSGFANTATLTVAAMFVLSSGLIRTGALETVTISLARYSNGSPRRLLFLLAIVIPVASAFINNTPVVVMMIPVILSLSRQFKVSASKLLLPVSYFSILGGTLTIFGTSTNILLNDLYRQSGGPGFGVFEFAPLGILYCLLGGAFIYFFGERLLPSRSAHADLADSRSVSTYISEVTLTARTTLLDQPVEATFSRIADGMRRLSVEGQLKARRRIENPRHLRGRDEPTPKGVELLTITRNGVSYQGRQGHRLTLQAGDRLTISGTPNAIAHFLTDTKIQAVSADEQWPPTAKGAANGTPVRARATPAAKSEQKLVEGVIMPESSFNHRTIEEIQSDRIYPVKILGVQHRGRPISHGLHSRRLESGDVLLLQATPAGLRTASETGKLLLIEGVERSILRADKNSLALLIMAGVIGLATITSVPIVTLALAGATLMVMTRCLRIDEAIRSLDSSTLLLLAAAIPLGYAMESTGLAATIVDLLLRGFGSAPPVVFLSIFYLITNLLAQVISAKAVAVLFAPIALSLATTLGVNPAPMIVAIAFGTAAGFLTPMGHQVNAIVMGPGNYTFLDYIKLGLPVTIITWLLATFGIPWIWPL